METGSRLEFSRQWPMNLVCGIMSALENVLSVKNIPEFRCPEWISIVKPASEIPCSKRWSCQRTSLPSRQWGTWYTVIFIHLLCSLWHCIDRGLGEMSALLASGLRLSVSSQNASANSTAHIKLSTSLNELQLWVGSSREITSNQCDTVYATL